jgi:hypothetical protein
MDSDGGIDDNINIVGMSGLIGAGSDDVLEIERSIVQQEETNHIVDTENVALEFQRRMATISASTGLQLDESLPPISSYESDEVASVVGVGNDIGGHNEPSGPEHHRYDYAPQFNYQDPPVRITLSEEQQKQRRLESALQSTSTLVPPMSDQDSFNLDKEKKDDKKNMMLEQINLLRTTLGDDGINIKDIQEVDDSDSFDDIDGVYKQLRYRNDHARYCSLAHEVGEVVAEGMEYLFDGERSYVGFTPDLTGWGATLDVKLRRLNYETSSIVSDTIRAANMSNVTRLAAELLPSMFLHSKRQKRKKRDATKSKNKTGPTNSDVQDALRSVRKMDDRSSDDYGR